MTSLLTLDRDLHTKAKRYCLSNGVTFGSVVRSGLENYLIKNTDKWLTKGTRNIVFCSGGKDSTACYLLAIKKSVPFEPVFCDTGNEHDETYKFIANLPKLVCGPEIKTIKADFTSLFSARRKYISDHWADKGVSKNTITAALDIMHPTGNNFLDLCLLKGRFPSSRARFCSQDLKHVPLNRDVIQPLIEQGEIVTAWQGVRADESKARADLPLYEHNKNYWIYRPIINWNTEQVFALHGPVPA